MTTFIDGPAAGQTLSLRRAPVLLRVVRSSRGKWDALDQLDDVANPQEEIYLYIITAPATGMHMRCSPPSAGGFFSSGIYKQLVDPPADDILRNNEHWAAWCEANRDRLTPDWCKKERA